MNDRDLDAEFERIIAGWDREAPDPQQSLPSSSTPTSSPTSSATSSATSAEAPPDEVDPGPVAGPPADRGFKETGLNLPIAPTTAHVWRGSEPAGEDVDELLGSTGVDDEDDHFTPPTEMDLPTAEEDPMFWAIVGGLGGGTLLLLYVLFFDRGGSGWWIVTAIAMIVVGFVLLVLRGGTERDPFDDGTRV